MRLKIPQILFQDDNFIVINKPAGMIVNKADTAKNEFTVQDWIQKNSQFSNLNSQVDSEFSKRGGIVHRLDKDTSGVLLVALNEKSFSDLQKQFKERTVKKEYIALVHGKLVSEGEINVPFHGFGIGGSFDKGDVATAVAWVNKELPEDKPRHLLGIGEPVDVILGIESGADTFDCVTATRMARNGSLYTAKGRINILNAQFTEDLGPIDNECTCYACSNYSRAYISHLFRAKEMLAGTLSSIHNLFFITDLVRRSRQAIVNGVFDKFKTDFLSKYK
jgi:hypothetical protein